eukprot:503804_1
MALPSSSNKSFGSRNKILSPTNHGIPKMPFAAPTLSKPPRYALRSYGAVPICSKPPSKSIVNAANALLLPSLADAPESSDIGTLPSLADASNAAPNEPPMEICGAPEARDIGTLPLPLLTVSLPSVADASNAAPMATPEYLLEQATQALLPASSVKYEEWFEAYKAFCINKGIAFVMENSLLAYLESRKRSASGMAPSSAFAYVSGIKAILSTNHDIATENWYRTKRWLKLFGDGYVTTSAPIFTEAEVMRWFKDFNTMFWEIHYLSMGMGLPGRMRAMEYTALFHEKCFDLHKEE